MLRTGDAAMNELTLERRFERTFPSKIGRVSTHSLSKMAAKAALSARMECVKKGGTVEEVIKPISSLCLAKARHLEME